MAEDRVSGEDGDQLKMRMRRSIRAVVSARGDQLRKASGPAVIGVLSASALAPVAAALAGAGPLLVAGTGVAGNIGANIAADLFASGLGRAKQSPENDAAVSRAIAERVEGAFRGAIPGADRIRTEVIDLFRAVDVAGVAFQSALDAGDEELARALTRAFIDITEMFGEFAFGLAGLRLAVEELQQNARHIAAQHAVDQERARRSDADLGRMLDLLHDLHERVLPSGAAGPASPARWPGCPYLGLAAFQERDAAIFCGRRELTRRLVSRLGECLDRPGILVVLGASGAGKSSLLRAGLMAAIAGDELAPGSRLWPRATMTPSADPVGQLSAQLATLLGTTANAVAADLRSDPGSAHQLVRQILANATSDGVPPRLVLIVDQFEELFLPAATDDGDAFVRALTTMATTPVLPDGGAGALVVACLRGDFVDRAVRYDTLRDAVESGAFVVGPMTEAELRAAVVEPARRAGSEVPDDLVTAVLDDLRNRGVPGGFDDGTLPLLSQVMFEVWTAHPVPTLTVEAYHEVGGAADIVRLSAERVYARLSPAEQERARAVFVLLSTDRFGVLSRRASSWTELRGAVEDPEPVVEAFAAARLITVAGDQVEIAHEELLRSWDRLRGWIVPDPADRALHQALVDDTKAWQENGRDSAYLYRGGRLLAVTDAVDRWAARPAAGLAVGAVSQEFLHAGRRRDRRRRRVTRAVAGAMTGLLLLTASAAILATWQARTARRQHDVALSRQLAIKSQLDRTISRTAAARLAATALALAPDDPAAHEAAAVILDHYRSTLPLTATADALAFGPGGETLVAAGSDGIVPSWSVSSGRLEHSLVLPPPVDGAPEQTLSRDGRVLMRNVGRNGSAPLGVWRLDTAGGPRAVALKPTDDTGFERAALSADGRRLATADLAERVQFWDLTTGDMVREFRTGNGPAANIEVSADGELAVVYGTEDDVRVFPRAGGTVRRLRNTQVPRGVAFSPDGRMLALAGDRSVGLWDTRSGERTRLSLRVALYRAGKLAFAADGSTLAVESGKEVLLWQIRTGRTTTIALPSGSGGHLSSMAFSPDGRRLATATGDGVVHLWDTRTGRLTDAGLPLRTSFDRSSPDLRVYLATDDDGVPRGYDTATGRPIGAGLKDLPGTFSQRAISSDNRMIAGDGSGDALHVFDLRSGERIGQPFKDLAGLNEIAFRPGHRQLALTRQNEDGVTFWDLDTNTVERHAVVPGHGALRLAVSRDGRLLAVSEDGNAGNSAVFRVFDIETRQQLGSSYAMPSEISDLVFSPDGGLVGAVDSGRHVRVWDTKSGESVAGIDEAHPSILAFSPDGDYIATAGADERVRIWRARDGRQIGAPINVGGYIGRVVFAPDGRSVVALSFVSTGPADDLPVIRSYELALYVDPRAALCGQVGEMTAVDAERFAPGEDLPDPCHDR